MRLTIQSRSERLLQAGRRITSHDGQGNCKQLTDDDSAITYETNAYAFTKSTMSAKYTPKVETAEQYGDGIKVEDYVAKDAAAILISR